jgi:hypothetical protein
MAKAKELLQVVLDTRLSCEARVLVQYVASRGDGPHEISAAEFSRALNQAGEKAVRRAVQDATEVGWITRTEGGRGHSPQFEFTPDSPALSAGVNADSPAVSAGLKPDSPAETAHLNGSGRHPATTDSPAQNANLSDSPAQIAGLNGGQARKLGEPLDGRMDGGNPPVVPPSGLSSRVVETFRQHAEILAGTRKALRDYLVARDLPETRQVAYIQRLVCGLEDGTLFRRPDGSSVPPAERTAIVASALNELLQHGEQKTALEGLRPMKWPDGDFRNLQTKIQILADYRPPPRDSRAAGRTQQAADERLIRHRAQLEAIDLNASRSVFE